MTSSHITSVNCQIKRNTFPKKGSQGVFQLKHLRGLMFSMSVYDASSSSEHLAMSYDLGKYCRNDPLVFSFVTRCQRECGPLKWTGFFPSASVMSACLAISLPRSSVALRIRSFGSYPSRAMILSFIVSACRFGTLPVSKNRSFLSTNVMTLSDLFLPTIKFPSQETLVLAFVCCLRAPRIVCGCSGTFPAFYLPCSQSYPLRDYPSQFICIRVDQNQPHIVAKLKCSSPVYISSPHTPK